MKKLVALFLFLFSIQLMAAPQFDHFGKIDAIDLENSAIMINDFIYELPLNVMVMSGNKPTSIQNLKAGQMVGVKHQTSELDHWKVLQIWILPINYTPPAGQKDIWNSDYSTEQLFKSQ